MDESLDSFHTPVACHKLLRAVLGQLSLGTSTSFSFSHSFCILHLQKGESRQNTRHGLRSRKTAKRKADDQGDEDKGRPPTSVHFSRRIFDKGLDSSSSDSDDNDSGIDGFTADPNDRGLYYKV